MTPSEQYEADRIAKTAAFWQNVPAMPPKKRRKRGGPKKRRTLEQRLGRKPRALRRQLFKPTPVRTRTGRPEWMVQDEQ